MSSTHVFYVPGQPHIVDEVRADGRSRIKGESLEELAIQYPGVEVWSWDDVLPAIAQAQRERYCEPVKEISQEQFEIWLNVLPPMHWCHSEHWETFMICEPIADDLHRICCRMGQRYFAFVDSRRMSNLAIRQRCEEFIQANP